jgi:hypothetical protein
MSTYRLSSAPWDVALAGTIDARDADIVVVPLSRSAPVIPDASALTLGRSDTQIAPGASATGRVQAVLAPLGLATDELAEWISDVAEAFARLMAQESVALRVEVTDEVTCPKFHVDTAHVRLVVTLNGAGTEYVWRRAPDAVHRVDTGTAVLLKGRRHQTHSDTVQHRSPQVASGARRVVIVVDLPA